MKFGIHELHHAVTAYEICFNISNSLGMVHQCVGRWEDRMAFKAKAKARNSYSTSYRETWPATLCNHRSGSWSKSQWCCSAKCGRPLHVLKNNSTLG